MLKETEKYSVVNRLKSSTYSTVSDNQNKLIPISIDNKDEFIEYNDKTNVYEKVLKTNRIYPTDRYHYINKWYSYKYSSDNSSDNFSIIKINNLPFRSFFNRYTKDYFMSRLDRMIYNNEIEPFLLFIDGKFIDWNDIILVYDAGDIYLQIYNDKFNHFVISHSKNIYLLILPFKINYISKDSDKIFDLYYNAYCKYMNENAFINKNKLYASVPSINDQYKYNNIYLDIGWWLITQLKLNYLGLLSDHRLKKLKNISIIKNVYNDDNEIIDTFNTVFNSFDKDSYSNNILEKFKNESLERCIENNIFRFDSESNLLDLENGDIIISEFSDQIDIYKYSSSDEYIKNISSNINNTLYKENYIVFEDGAFKYNPDIYTWTCNSSVVHNPDTHKCDVIIVNNNTVNPVHFNMNVFHKPYINQLVEKYFNIMIDNNYFTLDPNTNTIEVDNSKLNDSNSNEFNYLKLLDDLNKGLDFSYDIKKIFSNNLEESYNKIFEYNPLLFNELYKTDITSTVISGSEANRWLETPFTYESRKGLKLPRMKFKDHETYLMVFLNGELISTYSDMIVFPNFVFIPIENEFKDSDEIEILFFSKCNNNDFKFNIDEKSINKKLSRKYNKYDPVLKQVVNCNGNTITYIEDGKTVTKDMKLDRINLLKPVYNISNLGLFDEYFDSDMKIFSQYPEDILEYKELIKDVDEISFNVSCRNIDGDLCIFSDSVKYDLVAASSNKFVYQLLEVNGRAYKIKLNKRFRYCDNQKQYMLFINGRRMSDDTFLVTIPKYNRPFDYMYIYLTKFVSEKDKVELFYLPQEVLDINLKSDIELKENGYIECNKNALDIPYDNRLYLLFINGKKITKDDIINIDSSTFRIKKDPKSTSSLIISPICNNTIEELSSYLKSDKLSDYDGIIDMIKSTFSYDELDRLFNSFTKMSNIEEDKYTINVDKIAIINEIVRDFWISSGYNYNDKPFIYDYELDEFIHIDDNGNQILPSMDANPNINIIKEQLHLLYFYFDDNNKSGYIEMGRVLETPTFEWDYSQYAYNLEQDIISQQFNDIDLPANVRRYKYPYNVKSDATFTIKGFDGFNVCSSTIDIKFVAPIYYGLIDEDSLQHFDEEFANSTMQLSKLYAKDADNNIWVPIEILGDDADINLEDSINISKLNGVDQKNNIWNPINAMMAKDDYLMYREYTHLDDMIPMLTKSLQENCRLVLPNYIIGNNKYFVYAAPKRYVYDANGKLNISFFLPDLTNELLDQNMDEHTTPLYTDGTFDKDNTLNKLYNMSMVYLGQFEYTNEYNHCEEYVAFRTNGFFTRNYEDTKFNIYVRSNI